MKKLEIILITGAIIGLLLALFNTPLDSLVVSVLFTTLSCLYFYLGFALFNDIPFKKIFLPETCKGLGLWRILIAIGTGLALSILTFGIMCSVLSYPMAETFLVIGIVLAGINLILALIKNAHEKDQFYRNIILRCLIFIIIAVIFLLLRDLHSMHRDSVNVEVTYQ
jgi:uncharacterized membrane protein